MSSKHTKVAAVIPTFNRKRTLARCIDAVFEQTVPFDHLLVIDNASTDGTADMMAERSYLDSDKVTYVRLESNSGSAGGFHAGLKRAAEFKTHWIWVIDDDAIPEPTCLEMLLVHAAQLSGHRVGAMVSNRHQLAGKPIRYRLPRSASESFRYTFACPQEGIDRDAALIPLDWFTFISALLSAQMVEEIGLPMEEFFYFGEDIEYSLRARDKGFQSFMVLTSIVDHPREGLDTESLPGWRWYYIHRNSIYLFRTHLRSLGIPIQIGGLARVTAAAISVAMREALLRHFYASFLSARGIVDGYTGKLGKRVQPVRR
jgi:rhamnopyranosyl-N-acetylglucosaminyl-diphospho-decaprenol beta-1,3/1,4-galactofuranosyltransferase